MTTIFARCYSRQCKHYIGPNEQDGKLAFVCYAFPFGIPDDIAHGNNEHLKSIEGDDGIVYEKADLNLIIEKQLPIDEASKQALMTVRQNLFNEQVEGLAERLFTGDISIGTWEEQMRQAIREFHSSMAAIGKGGWGEMTQSDWGRVGAEVKKQYRYLHGFAENVDENRETISLDAIKARARMYGGAGQHTAYRIEASDFLAFLPWIPKDGSTECLTNCKCLWELNVIEQTKVFKRVQAIWRLQPAEHCEDCIDRNGYIETFQVSPDVDVPARIGGY